MGARSDHLRAPRTGSQRRDATVELYLAPLTLLFGLAALALSRNWRGGSYVHWVAIGAIFGLPFIDYALLF